MKSILLTLALLALVALGAGSTLAAFRNTQPSTGNTFQAGNLDILLIGRNNNGVITESTFFTVTNMKPGSSATAYVEVASPVSSNSVPALYRMYLDNAVQSPGNFANQLQVEVIHRPNPYSPAFSGNREGPQNELVYSGPLSGIIGANTIISNLNRTFDLGLLFEAGDLSVYKITVTMPLSWETPFRALLLQVE